MQKPIGIFGGTFDPVHCGHLRVALELYQRFGWQEVRLVPCRQSVLKGQSVASADQRLKMLELAVEGQAGLVVDQCELQRAAPSFMIDTLMALREMFFDYPLCLVIGYDVLLELPQWHRWQALLEYAHLVVIPRPLYVVPEHSAIVELIEKYQVKDAKLLEEKRAGALFFAELTPLAISATNIREQIAQGFSPRYLVPDAVWEFIQQEKLYL